MKNLIALFAMAGLLTACAGISQPAADGTPSTGAGAQGAAALGYHGPVHRTVTLYGN